MNILIETVRPVLLCVASLLAQSGSLAQTDDLVVKSQRAKELMAEGKFAQAIPLYRELNQAVPNNPGLMLNLGMALHMAGNEREAIPELEGATKLDPTLAPAWLFLGATRLHLGETTAAVKDLQVVLGLQPEHREARQMLASALLSLERVKEAAEEYRKLTELDPASPQAWYGLGRCYESLAGRAFDELQNTASGSAYWLALVAQARVREQQFSSAFYLYRQALEKMPTMRGLHTAVAEIYRQTGHPDWADAEEKKETRLPPLDCSAPARECDFRAGQYREVAASTNGRNTAESYYWRSRAYNELALQSFTRLGQLAPSAELHELKAHIYGGQKRYTEAAQEWRGALKFLPANPQIQKQLAISLKLGQDYNAALLLFQDLLRQQPASAELNYLVGDTMLDLGGAEEAIPFLKRALSRNPKLLAAHKSLARADLAVGKAAEAIPHLKAALATDEDGSLHYQLARAYQSSGQQELAKQVLAEYQKIQRSAATAREDTKQGLEITPP